MIQPRSLFVRLALLLLAVLTIVHSLTYAAIHSEIERSNIEDILSTNAAPMAMYLRLLNASAPATRENISEILKGLPDLQLTVTAEQPSVEQGKDSYSLFLLRHLQQNLPAPRDMSHEDSEQADGELTSKASLITRVKVIFPPAPSLLERLLTIFSIPRSVEMRVVVPLHAQGFVDMRYQGQSLSAATNTPFLLLCLEFVLLLGILLLITHRVVQPLRVLASRAAHFGATLSPRTPLPETGPEEMRIAARAFNSMQRRIVQNMEEREQIFAGLSHDLRTPLTRLRLRLESLKDAEARTQLKEDVHSLTAIVENSTALLRAPQTKKECPPLTRIDMQAFLESLVEDRQDMGEKVTLAPCPALFLCVEPVGLRRCLDNVLDNALRYGQTAHIHAHVEGRGHTGEKSAYRAQPPATPQGLDAQAKQALFIDVEDTGPGVPDKEMEKIFEPFYRLETSRNRNTGGSGLGLALTRSMLERQGGRVCALNMPGGGLRVRIELPLRD